MTTMPANSEQKPQTILIIDDTPTNLGVISEYLKGFGFEILVARDGESGLKRAAYVKPDIILLDVMMPGIDGFETCRRLKANEATQDIPVIFMTALAEAENKVRGFQAGAVDYVTKPMQQEEVLARVTTHLKIRDLTRGLQARNEDLQELSYELFEKNNHLVKLTDDLEDKNTQLEKMAAELRITNDGLLKVTDDLRDANMALSKRAVQLEASNQVGQQVTSILDLDELLAALVKLIQSKFGYYFVGVLLLSESKDRLVLQAGAGGDEPQWQTLSFSLDSDQGIVAGVCQTGQAYLANDVSADKRYLAVATLPNIRSELALPLRVGDEIIGVLDAQSNQLAGFDAEDQRVLQTLANQTAIAIRNARLYEMEKKLNADKDKFFSIISHDLRGPFTNLLGNAQFMLEMRDKLSEKDFNEMTQSIYNGAKAAYSLLDNLLTWSRMQREGGLACHLEPIELSAMSAETLAVLGQIAADKGIELNSAIPAGLWAQADQYMLSTVLRNLTGNALKFTPRGGQVTLLAQEIPAGFVTVSVKDTGVGMSEANKSKLFRIGENYSTLGTEREQGSGLGLIICQEMVERQGGRIWVESEGIPEQGAVVNFTISAAKSAG